MILALPEELFIKYALRPSTIWQASTHLQSKCFGYREEVCIDNTFKNRFWEGVKQRERID